MKIQTFLPLPSVMKSLRCLDDKRLGKQRVEAKQILKALNQGPKCFFLPGDKPLSPGVYVYDPIPDVPLENMEIRATPWYNHPAVLMWKGYETYLIYYYNLTLNVWERRGHNNVDLKPISFNFFPKIIAPPWFDDSRFHASHRSNLLRKDPIHYSQFGWKESDDLPYFWPTKEGYLVECNSCGDNFIRRHGNQKLCPNCKTNQDYYKKNIVQYKNIHTCSNCHKKFVLIGSSGSLKIHSSNQYYCSFSCKDQLEKRFSLYKPKNIGRPDRPSSKEEVCHEIYNLKDDPNSLMDIVEDWTDITCRKKTMK